MPRRARLDASGTLHHVMVQGIERHRIVNDVAKLVKSLAQLDRYRWCGHGVLMGKIKNEWQDRELSDDRILGSGEFVERIIKEADAKIKYQLPVKKQDQKIDELITKLCKIEKVSIKERIKIGQPAQGDHRCSGSDCDWVGKKKGIALAEVVKRVGVSTTAVSNLR